MNTRITVVSLIVLAAVVILVVSASSNTAKAVVTVQDLASEQGVLSNIRLGARVADREIRYETSPELLLEFFVKDIGADQSQSIEVVYRGAMPDTLKAGRDVILEGRYDGRKFMAKSLLTQCPSKYEAPLPGASKAAG